MVNCKKCGNKLMKGSNFCRSCGTPIKAAEPVEKPQPKKEMKQAKQRPAMLATAPGKPTSQKKEEPGDEKKSPYLIKKEASPFSLLKYPLIIVIAVIAVLAFFFMYPGETGPCVENWECTEWTECDGEQSRECTEVNECGTRLKRPKNARTCKFIAVINDSEKENVTVKPACLELGITCDANKDCCSDNCRYGVCRKSGIYCGDILCDEGENCTTCPLDCGECPGQRDLELNVYTSPLLFPDRQKFKEEGYVIVRYFYDKFCKPCTSPVHIEDQLRELAAEFKDLFVLVIIDTHEYRKEAETYAMYGYTILTPLIRVETENQLTRLSASPLGEMLQDGDIKSDVAELVCNYSEYCDIEDGKIVRTY